MKQTQTTRGISYGALSPNGEVVSTAEGKVICETAPGNPKHFVAPSMGVCYGNTDTCVTKQAIRKRRNGLLRMVGVPSPEASEFTALEYLESSGTQFIDTGIVTDGTYTIEGDMRVVSPRGSYWGRRTSAGGAESETFPDGNSLLTHIKPASLPDSVCLNYIWRGRPGNAVDVTQRHRYAMIEGQKFITVDGAGQSISAQNTYSVKAVNNNNLTYYLFCENKVTAATEKAVIAVYSFRMTDGVGNVVLDLVPILDANDTPCMYDQVNKLRFYNSGTGTFGYALKGQGASRTYSLRNRNAVAPSGVYARPTGDNELEILAETEETTGEGWEWFANTAEAYEYFGIVSEEEEELLTE